MAVIGISRRLCCAVLELEELERERELALEVGAVQSMVAHRQTGPGTGDRRQDANSQTGRAAARAGSGIMTITAMVMMMMMMMMMMSISPRAWCRKI